MVGLKEKINNRIHELEQNIVRLEEAKLSLIPFECEEDEDGYNHATFRIDLYSACILELKQVLEWI